MASVVVMVLLLRTYLIQEEIDRAARGRLAVGRVLASYVDAQLADQLSQLARSAGRASSASGSAGPMLEDLRSRLDPASYGVFLVDGAGLPIAAEPPEVGPVGAALVRRDEVVEALSAGRSIVSGVHPGPGGRAQFGIVVPVRTAGGLGALGAILDPTSPRLTELVEASLSLGGRTSAEVVDQFGVVVAATQRERTLLPGAHPTQYAAWLGRREAGTELASPGGADAEPHLIAFVPLVRAPWGLALRVPEAEVLAPLRRIDPPIVGLGLATLVLLVGLAALTARSVIGPVGVLIGAAGRMARGDLESSVPRAGGGELLSLSAALDEMRQDLLRAARAREEVDHLKDELISSVSHELRTPLGFVKGYTTTLLRQDTDWDSDTARQCLEIIDEASDQLLELVDHLLDISRINEGRLTVSPEPLALRPLIDEVVERMSIRTHGHQIAALLPSELPEVMADGDRIRQVLHNLIDNAIKYAPDGGAITVSAEPVKDRVLISVRDEGIGVPDGQLEAIFDRFNRGVRPEVRKIRGVGLGLPICRGIVEVHGGRIWAEPAPGRGTIVRFTLPLAVAAAMPGEAA